MKQEIRKISNIDKLRPVEYATKQDVKERVKEKKSDKLCREVTNTDNKGFEKRNGDHKPSDKVTKFTKETKPITETPKKVPENIITKTKKGLVKEQLKHETQTNYLCSQPKRNINGDSRSHVIMRRRQYDGRMPDHQEYSYEATQGILYFKYHLYKKIILELQN